MKNFSWFEATTIKEAQQQVNATVSSLLQGANSEKAILKSGGIDVMDLMKEGLIAPEQIVNIKKVQGLDKIAYNEKKGLRIGANATLASIEKSSEIKNNYLALHQAVAKAATPQLRNMSTLGGNLGQRTRCWYFRSIDHHCLRKGGDTCYAQNGENEFHAVMNNGTCASVHASSVATALMAFDAKIEILSEGGQQKEVAIKDFFVTPYQDIKQENVLKPGEIITAVVLPAVNKRTKSYYIKQGARQSYDWALADVAVVVELAGSKCKSAKVALGAATPVPIRSEVAEKQLVDNGISASSAKKAADLALEKATPLEKNGYKVTIFKTILQRAILKTV